MAAEPGTWPSSDAYPWGVVKQNMEWSYVLQTGDGYNWNAWGEQGYRHKWVDETGRMIVLLTIDKTIGIWSKKDNVEHTFKLQDWKSAVQKLREIVG